jgi:uncharacterized repeat protein (TIGR03806 family)
MMKKSYLLFFSVLLVSVSLISCSSGGDDYEEVSPVTVDLSLVPYPKLSDYKFFEGEMKNLEPALHVLPFQPASSLFSDYAHKKRFVWMPPGTKASFVADNKALELPVGAVLIKTFFYEDVQNITPVGGTRIVETRLMIRKADGWAFYNYVWNAAQTEAELDNAGSFTEIVWNQNGTIKNTNYKIPAEEQCIVCHKKRTINDLGEVTETVYTPIGIKPQNLNFGYAYQDGLKNQLTKWIEAGYLEDNFALPTAENTVIDYNDTSKSLTLRARSYVDSNCSHCHSQDRHCDYRPMRFAFSENGNPANMGVCVDTEDMQDFPPALSKIVTPGNINRSMIYYRLNTVDEAVRMPLHGRSIIHDEGIVLIEAWINSLAPCE